MALVEDPQTQTCVGPLAQWDQGLLQPIYSPLNGGTFTFIYTNGQSKYTKLHNIISNILCF